MECKQHLMHNPLYFKGRLLRIGDCKGQLSKKLRDAVVQKPEREALYCSQLQLCTHWPQQVSTMVTVNTAASWLALCDCIVTQSLVTRCMLIVGPDCGSAAQEANSAQRLRAVL